MDDFGFWMGKKLGYFDGLEVVPDMQPGPRTAPRRSSSSMSARPTWASSPGIFTFALENGMKLKSAFHWGALDAFSLAAV